MHCLVPQEVCTLFLAAHLMGDQLTPLNWLGFAVCLLGISLHVALKALRGKEGGQGRGRESLFVWALEGQLTPPFPRRAKGHEAPRGAWLPCRPGALAAAELPGGGGPPALSSPLGKMEGACFVVCVDCGLSRVEQRCSAWGRGRAGSRAASAAPPSPGLRGCLLWACQGLVPQTGWARS